MATPREMTPRNYLDIFGGVGHQKDPTVTPYGGGGQRKDSIGTLTFADPLGSANAGGPQPSVKIPLGSLTLAKRSVKIPLDPIGILTLGSASGPAEH